MDFLTRDALKMLIARRAAPSISLYLPTHRNGAEIQQDPIRLKNLIRSALESPGARAFRASDLVELMKPLQELTGDTAFWHEQGDGLALFRAPAFLQSYRLPHTFPEISLVADRFHVKPLLPLLLGEGRFWLLALSQKAVHLYHVSRQHMEEIVLAGAPQSPAEAVRHEVPGKPTRGRQRPSRPPAGSEQLYHGKGHDRTELKERLAQFFRQVDQAVAARLRTERVPLVMAGVDFDLAIYRSVNSHPQLIDDSVSGNPDNWSATELQEKAWAVLNPYFQKERRAAEDKFRELDGTGSATNDLGAVLPAAHEGRVESLFVAVGVQRWGRFDGITYTTEQHEAQRDGDEDLLDLAAIQTLVHHGRVFAVPPAQVPQAQPGATLAAVFRY